MTSNEKELTYIILSQLYNLLPRSAIEYHNESVYASRTVFADSVHRPPLKPHVNTLSGRYSSQYGGVGIQQEALSVFLPDHNNSLVIQYVGDKRLTFVEVPIIENHGNSIYRKFTNAVSSTPIFCCLSYY